VDDIIDILNSSNQMNLSTKKMELLFTSDEGGGIMFSPARPSSFVCLSVCVQVYSETRAWIWMTCCVSTESGHGRTD